MGPGMMRGGPPGMGAWPGPPGFGMGPPLVGPDLRRPGFFAGGNAGRPVEFEWEFPGSFEDHLRGIRRRLGDFLLGRGDGIPVPDFGFRFEFPGGGGPGGPPGRGPMARPPPGGNGRPHGGWGGL
jgi:hypothetical protein